MPESRGRDNKPAYTPPRSAHVPEPNPSWWLPMMVTLFVLGLIWLVTYYVSDYKYPVPSIGHWNLGVGFAFLLSGFVMAMRWR